MKCLKNGEEPPRGNPWEPEEEKKEEENLVGDPAAAGIVGGMDQMNIGGNEMQPPPAYDPVGSSIPPPFDPMGGAPPMGGND